LLLIRTLIALPGYVRHLWCWVSAMLPQCQLCY